MTRNSFSINNLFPASSFDRKISLWVGGFLLSLALVLYGINRTLTNDGAGFYLFLSTVAIVWGIRDFPLRSRTLWLILLVVFAVKFIPVSGMPVAALIALFATLCVLFVAVRYILQPRTTWPLIRRLEQPWWILPVLISGLPFILTDQFFVLLLAAVATLILCVRADSMDNQNKLKGLFFSTLVFAFAIPILIDGFIIDPIYSLLYFPKYIRIAISFNLILLIAGSLLLMVRIFTTPIIRNIRLNSPIRTKLILSFLFTSVLPFFMMALVVFAGVFVWMSSFQSRMTQQLLMEPADDLVESLKKYQAIAPPDSTKQNAVTEYMRFEVTRTSLDGKPLMYRFRPLDSTKVFHEFSVMDTVTSPYRCIIYDGRQYSYVSLLQRKSDWIAMQRPMMDNDLQRCKQRVNADLVFSDVMGSTPQNSGGININFSGSNTNTQNSKARKTLSTITDTNRTGFTNQLFPVGFILLKTIRFDQKTTISFTIVRVYQTLGDIYKVFSGGDNQILRALFGIQIFVTIVVLLIVLVAINVGFQISRLIAGSADRLIAGTLALRRSELDYRIPVESRDELGEVSYSFNLMAEDISRMLAEIREKERMQRDLDIARTIQIGLLPSGPPTIEGWQVAARSEFAQEVGGDFYDFIPMPDNRYVITLGDVSGKGIPAAMLMANVQATVRALCSMYNEPRMIVTKLNEELVRTTAAELFVTLFFAVLDCATGEIHYVNAGHDHPYLWQNKQITELEVGGTVIGAFSGMNYGVGLIKMTEGDRLLIFSDGITEAGASTEEVFGNARLSEVFLNSVDNTADNTLDELFNQVDKFAEGVPPSDDRTVICIRKI